MMVFKDDHKVTPLEKKNLVKFEDESHYLDLRQEVVTSKSGIVCTKERSNGVPSGDTTLEPEKKPSSINRFLIE